MKELEENLRKEIVAKSELSSKLVDIELSNVKLSNELARNKALLSEVQATNLSQKVNFRVNSI